MGLFVSHATADKKIVDALVDLLQTGLDIPQSDIFCSSLEGLSIPHGSTFVQFIHSKLSKARFVIAVLSPTYYERPFCLCELGATWITQQDFFPLLVPPLGFDDLKAVLIGVQSGPINDATTLNELRDRLIKSGWASGSTARWEVKRDEFIRKFSKIKVSAATSVPVAKYTEAQQKYDAAQAVIDEKNDELAKLEELVDQLKQCKDKKEVEAVVKASKADDVDQCEVLIEEAHDALAKLSSAVIEAIYNEHCGRDWNPKSVGNEELWEQIDTAIERGFLQRDETGVWTRQHPKVTRAKEKIENLRVFIEEDEGAAESDFVNTFEDEHDYPLDLNNRDFWEEHLGL